MSGSDVPNSIDYLRRQQESYKEKFAEQGKVLNEMQAHLEKLEKQTAAFENLRKAEEKKVKQLDLAKKISKQFAEKVTSVNRQLEEKQALLREYVHQINTVDFDEGVTILAKMGAVEVEMKNLAKKRDDTNAQAQRNFASQMRKQEAAKREDKTWEKEAGSRGFRD